MSRNLLTEEEIQEKIRRKEKLRGKRRARHIILTVAELLLCAVLGLGCYTLTLANNYEHGDTDESFYVDTDGDDDHKKVTSTEVVTETVEVTDAEGNTHVETVEKVVTYEVEIDKSSYRNILILGTDARSMDKIEQRGANSDVMIIASINNKTGEIKMVSVLRDTILRLEDGTYNKANAQFARSGIADTVSMINRNFGLNIKEYVVVNWYGVAMCINQLGGVDITLPNNEKVINAFNGYLTAVVQSTGLGSQQIWQPGTYTMDGPQVVSFCRIRYGGFEDEGRALNQRETIGKIVNKAKTLMKNGQSGQVLEAARTALSNVKTNLSPMDVYYMVYDLVAYDVGASYQFPKAHYGGKYVGDLFEMYHIVDPMVTKDFVQEVKDLHAFLYGDTDYHPSDTILTIGREIEEHRLAK